MRRPSAMILRTATPPDVVSESFFADANPRNGSASGQRRVASGSGAGRVGRPMDKCTKGAERRRPGSLSNNTHRAAAGVAVRWRYPDPDRAKPRQERTADYD